MNIDRMKNFKIANFANAQAQKVHFTSACDSFQKTISSSIEGINKKIASILNTDEIPVFKNPDEFKKPFLGLIGKSQEKQAYLYNSSEEMQTKTKNLIENVKEYITKQTKEGNIEKAEHSIGSCTCEFKNGFSIEAYEPYGMYCDSYTPLKTLTLKMRNSDDKIVLRAYSGENDSLIFKIMDIIKQM